jgi:hypothetical protein
MKQYLGLVAFGVIFLAGTESKADTTFRGSHEANHSHSRNSSYYPGYYYYHPPHHDHRYDYRSEYARPTRQEHRRQSYRWHRWPH